MSHSTLLCHTPLYCFALTHASAPSSAISILTFVLLSSSRSQEVLCSTCRGKFRRQRLHELGEAGITLGPNGIPCIDTVSSSMCEGTSQSDEDCVGDDSQEEDVGDIEAEDTTDGCPAVSESCEADTRYFTDTTSSEELTDSQNSTEISTVASISCPESIPIGACTVRVSDSVPYSPTSNTTVIFSSSSGVNLPLSEQISQSHSHLPSHHTSDIMHYDSALSGTQEGEHVVIGAPSPSPAPPPPNAIADADACADGSTDGTNYHRIDSFEEFKGSLLPYKCIVSAIPSKVDKCSVVSLTDSDDSSSSHSSNIDDDILSAGCPYVQSSVVMCSGHAALFAGKISIDGFGSLPISPCIDPL